MDYRLDLKRQEPLKKDEIEGIEQEIFRLRLRLDEHNDVETVSRIFPFIEARHPTTVDELWDELDDHAWRSNLPPSAARIVKERIELLQFLISAKPSVLDEIAVNFTDDPSLKALTIGLGTSSFPTLKDGERSKISEPNEYQERIIALESLFTSSADKVIKRFKTVPTDVKEGNQEVLLRTIDAKVSYLLLEHLAKDLLGKSPILVKDELIQLEKERYFETFADLVVEYLRENDPYWGIHDEHSLRLFFQMPR